MVVVTFQHLLRKTTQVIQLQ